jgi:aminoglycoside 3-N-acetyltransferase
MDAEQQLASWFDPIEPGSTLLLHSSAKRILRRTRATPLQVVDALLSRLGPQGTLVVPTFNFGFCQGEPFDIRHTPSKMGALTEAARASGYGRRTAHPVYSFQAIGQHADAFAQTANTSGYGPDSPFALLHALDGWVGVLDLSDQHSMTYYHHVEERHNVPWRYHKPFAGTYTDASGVERDAVYSLFVRDLQAGVLTHVDPMGEILWEQRIWTGQRPGEGNGLRIAHIPRVDRATENIVVSGRAENILWRRDTCA